MESLLKFMPVSALYAILALGLLKLGNALKAKDDNDTGADDAAGTILIALAPAISALDGNNDRAVRKALTVARDAITNYLTAKT